MSDQRLIAIRRERIAPCPTRKRPSAIPRGGQFWPLPGTIERERSQREAWDGSMHRGATLAPVLEEQVCACFGLIAAKKTGRKSGKRLHGQVETPGRSRARSSGLTAALPVRLAGCRVPRCHLIAFAVNTLWTNLTSRHSRIRVQRNMRKGYSCL